jgi:hypothetical protein
VVWPPRTCPSASDPGARPDADVRRPAQAIRAAIPERAETAADVLGAITAVC